MRVCNKCKTEKEDSCFGFKNKSKNIRNTICKTCRNVYTKSHYYKNKDSYLVRIRKTDKIRKKQLLDKFLLYLSDKSCIVCGENDIRVLEFDHRDREDKKDAVYTLVSVGCSWETIMTEINKCDILCANCHKKRTNKQFGLYRQKFLEQRIAGCQK